MKLAVLLAALCSGGSGSSSHGSSRIGVSAFQMPHARTPTSPGLANPSLAVESLSAVMVRGLPRICSPAPARRAGRGLAGEGDVVTVGGRSEAMMLGSRLWGTHPGSPGGEEMQAEGPAAKRKSGDGSHVDEKPGSLLGSLGTAGLVAYGLLNALWYCSSIAYLMLGPMGKVSATSMDGVFAASVKQLGKVIGLAWLGSQATKPLRLALAAASTPAADKLIVFTQRRLRLPNKKNAATILMGSTLASTIVFYLAIIALGAARAAVMVSTGAAPKDPSLSSVLLLLGLGRGRGLRERFGNDDYFCAASNGGGGGGGIVAPASFPSFLGAGAADLAQQSDNRGVPRPRARSTGSRIGRGTSLFRGATTKVNAAQQQQEQRANQAGPQQQLMAAATAADSTVAEGAPAGSSGSIAFERGGAAPFRRRAPMSPQKAANRNPPPQDNIHGWNEHPNHLLGLWEVGRAEALPLPDDSWAPEAVAAAAPSVAAAASIAAAAAAREAAEAAEAAAGMSDGRSDHSSRTTTTGISDAGNALPSSISTAVSPGEDELGAGGGEALSSTARPPATGIEAGGFSYSQTAERDMIDLGSDILHHMEYVVFRRGGKLKVGPSDTGVAPRSWRFTPASRRILFEVDVPARGITLRYSAKLKRLPGKFTRAEGIIRVRPSDLDLNGDWKLPSSSRRWPKLAAFKMELDLPEKFRHKRRGTGDEISSSRKSAQTDER